MSVVAQLEQQESSPLASARLHRKLTVEEAARRAGLTADQIEWLEEGRVYRFPSADDALAFQADIAAGGGMMLVPCAVSPTGVDLQHPRDPSNVQGIS